MAEDKEALSLCNGESRSKRQFAPFLNGFIQRGKVNARPDAAQMLSSPTRNADGGHGGWRWVEWGGCEDREGDGGGGG